ncbi:drug resistance transporter, EmrB/QacA subfamily [Desulfosporosinus orientis DSM 765]|uniref:Drug resistance transporter, EmrB/QacA subfamily n=1 Tax=Desulfosporosinus orientis (strain ATCC 19365 / DSM 765 / NCIMB 8382 / VKM B-1628 / Singapore I) TaxID=768706 RepID=G7WC02_DESOD|nr:MFS transporter [Desulfosporosinus orientis]AET69976.1 drug resistance transporter, EmrB/QacA subfamily [Desulfosporosinus orientis DSM 765]
MLDAIKTSQNYRWYVLATVAIGTFMATLDSSIVNVALPTISGQFHSDLTTLQWVVSAYLLTITSLLPVFGRIADMFGRKKIYTLGFVMFTMGSVLCGFAQNIWFLVGTRVLQAVGASMLMSNSAAIITAIFPPKERGRALGFTGSVVALGSLTGPALGGLLIGFTSWRAIFFINLPIGIIGYFAACFILPKDLPSKDNESFDFTGAFAFTFGMIFLLLGITNGESWGWLSVPVLASLVLGIVSLVGFVFTERRVQHPMIDLSLFRNRPFLIGNLSGGLSFVAMFANNMLLPFYLQGILHYKPTQVGLMLMVFPMVMVFVAPVSGHASDKFGPIILTTSGLAISSLGLFYFSTLPATASFIRIIPGPILMGLGSGMFQSPNNSSVMSSVPPQKLSIAGGINSLVRNLGMVIGIAFSVSLFDVWGGVTLPQPSQVQGFMSAYHSVMLVAMGIAFVAALISYNRKSYAKSN